MNSRLTTMKKSTSTVPTKKAITKSTDSETHSSTVKKTGVKRTTSPITSPLTARKDISSSFIRASTSTSNSNSRRNSSLYGLTQSPIVNIQELEELSNLNTQLNQWIYLNAMTAEAYESQKNEAEKQLYDGYNYISKQKNLYNNLKQDNINKNNIIKVNEDLKIQNESITTIENQFSKFKQIYEDFLVALHSTASKMTTQGIVTNDIENLTKQFNECEQNLKILTEQKEKLEKVNELSSLINSLNSILNEEMEELNEFKDLLNKLKKAETLNNSLQIQYTSLINKE